jgi:hypothetical protein
LIALGTVAGRGVLLCTLATAPALFMGCSRAESGIRAIRSSVSGADSTIGHAPPGVRIKVEVLNATRTRGLARRATLYLRDRGFDVVSMGNSARTQDATLVLDRSNHPAWAKLIAEALEARVESRPDTSRYLDATVIIGGDWTPPTEAFYP